MRFCFNKRVLTFVFILFTLSLLAGCQSRFINSGVQVLKEEDAKDFTVEKTEVNSITKIDINTRIADVKLIPSDKFYIEINYSYWAEEPIYTLEDGKLLFDDRKCIPDSYSINFDIDNSIKVYLPDNTDLSGLFIDCSSGDVDLSGFVTDEMGVTVAYGDLTIKKAAAIESDITLSAGNSKISDFQVGKLDFTNSYGDAQFTKINYGDSLLPAEVSQDEFDVSMSSGDVIINTLNCKNVQIDNSYGDITCQEVIADDFDSQLSSGKLVVSKSELKEINADNSYGDVDLNLIGSPSEYSLDLNTSYGNIQVGNESFEDRLILDHDTTKKITADLSSGDIEIDFKDK